jgi:predicted DNA-binding transcriptional regulator AlpA
MGHTAPYWPRGMNIEMASQYVGLSASLFAAEVQRGHIPQPTWLTKGRKIWLIEDIDEYLDRKKNGMLKGRTWQERLEDFD